MLFYLATIFLIATLPVIAQSDEIVVTANAKNADPTLVFTSGLSDQTLSAKILSDLNHCGWFDVRKSGNTTYHVSAKGSLQDFTVSVSNSAGVQATHFSAGRGLGPPNRENGEKTGDRFGHFSGKSSFPLDIPIPG